MKKIININLAGRVIPIEDSAYESLQRYIESLRRYFAHEEGRDEIINDIESRIAELMNEKVRKGAAAVTDEDIEEIIHSMGRVEDFEEAEAFESTNAGEQTFAEAAESENEKYKGRLYRNESDKIIGGVCSGIANYLNIDPAIVRLLFAIITFGGFGMGFLIYILLWIILPSRPLQTYLGKRLYRNPDDRIIGGVAGGLAAYFNKQTWIIRLIFAAPLVLNIFFSMMNGIFSPWRHHFPADFAFGSLTGTFILAYIILWIVLPLARNTYEKMEMRGEKVDVNRIRQNVKEEMDYFKNRAQSWGEEVKSTAQHYGRQAREIAGTHATTFASEVRQTTRPVRRGFGHVIGVLFKAFFLIVAGSIAFGFFVVVLVFTIGGIAQPFKDFLIDGFWQNVSLWGTLVFFLAIPLIALITWMVRRLLKVRSQNHYLGWTFGSLWLLGFICLGIFITTILRDFRFYKRVEEPVVMNNPTINKLTLRVDEPPIHYSGTYDWLNPNEGFDITEDTVRMANVKLWVLKSNDSLFHVTILKYSAGTTSTEALQRAEKVTYTATSVDSSLILGSGLGVSKQQKFRGQKVLVEIKVPVGKKILFDESIEDKLHPVNIRISNRRRQGRDEWDMDWENSGSFNYQTNTDYIMTSEGELEEADKFTNSPVQPLENNHAVADSIRREIEKRNRQNELDKQKLKEVEKNTTQQNSRKETTAKIQFPSFSFII